MGELVPLSEDDLVDSRTFLSDVGFWPDATKLNVRGWLANFDEGADRETAISLLESFVHMNEAQVTHGTLSALRGLSARPEFGPAISRQKTWETFIDRAFISFPSGSAADVTGSGHIFARIMKDAGFDEGRILGSDDLVVLAAKTKDLLSVVFLDDLAASGTQFTRTWKRQVQTPHGKSSLALLANNARFEYVYYAPLAATVDAMAKILKDAPTVVVQPGYVIEREYFASSDNTRLVPEELRTRLAGFLDNYTPRSGNDQYGSLGFGDLGLALSFHHSIPNNTLPILQRASATAAPSWKSLTT
jgi:hypothetical protein